MLKKLLTIFTATFILSLTLVSYDASIHPDTFIAPTDLYEKDESN